MELEEFYKQVGGNFEDVKRRLLNEEFIRKFVLKFKDDETFDNLIDAFDKADYKESFRFIHTLKGTSVNLGFDDLYQASCNLTECLREKENLNDEELEEAHSIYTVIQTEEARYKALGNELNDDTYNNTEYKKELTETITKKTGIQNVTFGTCSYIGKDNAKYYVNFKSDDGKNVYSVIKRNKDITVSVN